MSALSIAHVLSSFDMGGQERVALDLATRQRAAGHRVLAISLAEAPDGPMASLFHAADVRTERVARRGPSFDPTLAVRIAKYLWRDGVEVAHTHNPQALVYGSPAAALARAACVHTKHGINPDRSRRMWLRRAASKIVDAYVAVTPALARVAITNHECDPSQLHIISNGIDTQRFSPDLAARARIRAELGIPEDAWVVGTVGRLAAEKNQALLIDAISPILDHRRHLVIVGEGPEREALAARASATWCNEFLHFTGARTDVESLLAAFDLFALTSDSEGLPLVLLEAMAMGLPVLATAVGGVPDLVEHGTTGFLVAPGDCLALTTQLIRLSGRPDAAFKVAKTARNLVLERHSTKHMTRDYENLYQRVARRTDSSQPVAASG